MTRWGVVRRLRLGARWDQVRKQRGRLPLTAAVGASLLVVSAAVSASAGQEPGLHFAPGGHWVANPALDLVFHVNGGARSVDAQAEVPGLEPGSQVVQGDTSGYVVGESRIVEFGKSDLTVERQLAPPTGERPVAIEAQGGPYLVYREAGTVVRLGDTPATIPAGGALGEPVTTADGTLWVHRLDSGVICKLPRGADRISCPATAPRGDTGVLTVVRDRVVFVDTTSNTLSPVGDDGLGRATRLGVDAPATVRIAPVDVDGRIAILDPDTRRMHLVDASGVGTGREGAPPVTVALPDGDYSAPSATRTSVVLLDRRGHTVLTYSAGGDQLRSVAVPKETVEPRLTRGGDGRVYVDGDEGKHVLVVDHGGGVGQVPISDGRVPSAAPSGSPTPSPSATGVAPPTPPGGTGGDPAPTTGAPRNTQRPPRTEGTRPQAPRTTPAAPRATPPIPASPPGMPPNLRAATNGGNLRVTWGAAAANGAAVGSYQVSWVRVSGGGSGSSTRPGSARSYSISGLSRGVAYRITVAAVNSAGRSSPATVQATLPQTRTVTVSRGPNTNHSADCRAPRCGLMHVVLRGFAPNTAYQITPRSSHPSYRNPGARLTTDGQGYLDTDRFAFGMVGEQVWVVVDGVESNHFTWVSG